MRIETTDYEATYGRRPRGMGLWAFGIQRRPGEWTEVYHTGTYTEAARHAKAEAKTIGGAYRIVVIS